MLERRIIRSLFGLFGIVNPDPMTVEMVNQKFSIHKLSLTKKMALGVIVPAMCTWLDMRLTGEIKGD